MCLFNGFEEAENLVNSVDILVLLETGTLNEISKSEDVDISNQRASIFGHQNREFTSNFARSGNKSLSPEITEPMTSQSPDAAPNYSALYRPAQFRGPHRRNQSRVV
jgi:hypothetical protein